MSPFFFFFFFSQINESLAKYEARMISRRPTRGGHWWLWINTSCGGEKKKPQNTWVRLFLLFARRSHNGWVHLWAGVFTVNTVRDCFAKKRGGLEGGKDGGGGRRRRTRRRRRAGARVSFLWRRRSGGGLYSRPVWRQWPVLYPPCLAIYLLITPLSSVSLRVLFLVLFFFSTVAFKISKLLLTHTHTKTHSSSGFHFHTLVPFSFSFALSHCQCVCPFLSIPLSIPHTWALPACWARWPVLFCFFPSKMEQWMDKKLRGDKGM